MAASKLFTFVMDYRGGTYVAQARAADHLAAIRRWSRELDSGSIQGMGLSGKRQLLKAVSFRDLPPQPLEELVNAWCLSVRIRGQLAVINFIQTGSSR